jgi:FeS assembly protein IscX
LRSSTSIPIVSLPDFDDDAEVATEGKLEAVVLAWHAQL